jgi:hypothetical protein
LGTPASRSAVPSVEASSATITSLVTEAPHAAMESRHSTVYLKLP